MCVRVCMYGTYMYVYVYACTVHEIQHIHVRVCMYTCMYNVCTVHACIRVCIYGTCVYVYACVLHVCTVHTCTCTCMHVHVYIAHVCTCMYVGYMRVRVYACIVNVCTCMYVCRIHACTCIHVQYMCVRVCTMYVRYMRVRVCIYSTCVYVYACVLHVSTCMHVRYTTHTGSYVQSLISILFLFRFDGISYMRDEKEERKQARSNKQTRQSNTAHPRQSLFLEKMNCLGWDSNPRHSIL